MRQKCANCSVGVHERCARLVDYHPAVCECRCHIRTVTVKQSACDEHQFPEEETPDGVRLLLPCLNCGLPAADGLKATEAELEGKLIQQHALTENAIKEWQKWQDRTREAKAVILALRTKNAELHDEIAENSRLLSAAPKLLELARNVADSPECCPICSEHPHRDNCALMGAIRAARLTYPETRDMLAALRSTERASDDMRLICQRCGCEIKGGCCAPGCDLDHCAVAGRPAGSVHMAGARLPLSAEGPMREALENIAGYVIPSWQHDGDEWTKLVYAVQLREFARAALKEIPAPPLPKEPTT